MTRTIPTLIGPWAFAPILWVASSLNASALDQSCHGANSNDDVELLKQHGVSTDGSGYGGAVYFEELDLSESEFAEVIGALVRMKTVETVQFKGTPIRSAFARELPRLRMVKDLKFSDARLDATVVRAAASLPNLAAITIYRCQITGDVMTELGKCTSLSFISLVECGDLNGDVFSSLAPLKDLKILVIRYSPKVSDEGIAAIRHYPAIESLMLDGTSVSDELFDVIDGSRTIKKVSVSRTKVSVDATNGYRARHPEVELFPRVK